MSCSPESSDEHVGSKHRPRGNADYLQLLLNELLENLHQSEMLRKLSELNSDQLAQLIALEEEEEHYKRQLQTYISDKPEDNASNTDATILCHKSNQVTVEMLTTVPVPIAKTATRKLKYIQAILKLCETGLGMIVLAYTVHFNPFSHAFLGGLEHTFMLLISFSFLLTTILLFIPNILTFIIGDTFSESIFETLYHIVAFVFYICGSLAFLVTVVHEVKNDQIPGVGGKIIAAVLGLLNSAFYLSSAVLSIILYIRR